jgi:homoserine O-acetyltransferase
VLICHALTGDQYVADPHPITGKPGWWTTLVGPAACSTPSAIS